MEAFENRLKKNQKHLAKWALRNGVTCYRVYDHDIPEFPFAIDRYDQLVHVATYKSKRQESSDYEALLNAASEVIMNVLQVAENQVYFKERKVFDRRATQYEKEDQKLERTIVTENGLKFWVNLSDYLDTGLFLDHRPLRTKFLEEAKGKSVLNLFAYTGSFSVYAKAAGAKDVCTVDLSATYLQWAKDNFELNGFEVENDSFVQQDVMQFLKQYQGPKFDLVIVDPPTFSNSKRMKGTWDTQRDHPLMLHLITKNCKPGARIYFSNNFRNFEPQFGRLKSKSIVEISKNTIPEDFRNKSIHKCYQIDI